MCMIIVLKALLISSATGIVRSGGAIWLKPFGMVLLTVCSAVTVEWCVVYPCCVGGFGMFAVVEGIMLFSSVFAITERRDMGLYEVSLSLFGFGMGTMLTNFHIYGIILLLRAVFDMLVSNASLRGPMCFRCLVFSLSGPGELLFLLCFMAS